MAMAANVAAARRSISHDRMRDGYSARSSRIGSERYHTAESSMENLAPILMPSGLNSMLKNTTETGDIGLFSIKPSRLPRHNPPASAPGIPKPAKSGYQDLAAQSPDFSLFVMPAHVVDDRRRLPSYSRDVTSEIASLYENASQKSSTSSRFYVDDSEQRSYSMTQTSYSGSRLANHRSYASLRSQGDLGNGQRPRSPFPYPTRLKRPGFRPSSPALTDGGAVDYSRRAEIDREPSTDAAISQTTLEIGRKTPQPLAIRTDVNRSTPAPRSTGATPQLSRNKSAATLFHDAASIPLPPSTEVSPTRSRSMTSNRGGGEGRMRSRASSSGTAGRVPCPSPLYYDYTESFYQEDEVEPLPVEEMHITPAPPFLLERTIHEDRELSSDWSYLAMTDLRGRGFLASEGLQAFHGEAVATLATPDADTSYTGAARASPLRNVETLSDAAKRDEFDKRLAAIPVRQTDEIEASGAYQASPIGFDGVDDRDPYSPEQHHSSPDYKIKTLGLNAGTSATLGTECVISSPALKSAPGQNSMVIASIDVRPGSDRTSGMLMSNIDSATEEGSSAEEDNEFEEGQRRQSIRPGTPLQLEAALRHSYQRPQADGVNMSEPAVERVSAEALPANALNLFDFGPTIKFPKPRRVVQTDYPRVRRETYQSDGATESDAKTKLNKYKSDSDLRTYKYGVPELEAVKRGSMIAIGAKSMAHMSYPSPRNPREVFANSSSDSDIIAPIPIYPARELRVKNSIPQLMKALPPLPLRTPGTQPVVSLSSKAQLKRPAPLKLNQTSLAPRAAEAVHGKNNPTTPVLQTSTGGTDSEKPHKSNIVAPQPFMSRFRLKPRSPAPIPEPSPPQTRPWNLEESYPWNAASDEGLPSPLVTTQKSGIPTPKLRLRTAKRSTSPLGTVRVTRDATQDTFAAPDLSTTRDLFSAPSSSLTNMFRKVSRQQPDTDDINKMVPAGSTAGSKSRQRPFPHPSHQEHNADEFIIPRLTKDKRSATSGTTRSFNRLTEPASHEVRKSLVIETSDGELRKSLRKKMSGLKARLPISSMRSPSRLSADRTRPTTLASETPLINSRLEISTFDGAGPTAPHVRRSRRIKAKIAVWFNRLRGKKQRNSDE